MATATKQDYYETLSVGRKAGVKEIRKAYKRLARKHHPDLNPGDKVAEERFKRIQEAYDVLSDPKKRQMYDQLGFYSEQGMPPRRGSRPGQAPPNFDFSGFDFSNFAGGAARGGRSAGKGGFGEGLRDLFSQFFSPHATGASEPASVRGEDLEYEVPVGFWEAIRGTVTRLHVPRHQTCRACGGSGTAGGSTAAAICPECGGSGQLTQAAGTMRFQVSCSRCRGTGRLPKICPGCHGEGRSPRSESLEVRIPAGAQSGSRLRIAAKGNAGVGGGPPGDLFIVVRIDPHSYFRREGDDIHITVPITVSEAALGAKIEVPTIEGRALWRVAPGTQNGQRFRLRERGVLSARTRRRGDQYVEVRVQVPRIRDERSKEILRELSRLNPEDPRAALFIKE